MVFTLHGIASQVVNLASPWTDAFLISVSMVGVAEVFDKTWFVALVMALRHEKTPVFWGCYAGLALHVPIAAVCGYSLTKAFSPSSLELAAAALYAVMAVLYAWDWYTTEKGSDIFTAGREEAAEAIQERASLNKQPLPMTTSSAAAKATIWQMKHSVFFQCFLAVFIAEWGDRTQIAMVGLHASQPLYPVMAGSLVAFFFLTISAIMVAIYLSDKELSEKSVKAVVALSFAAFTLWSLHDAYSLRNVKAVHPQLPAAAPVAKH